MAGALCAPAAAVTTTASNVETRMRPPRFMDRKLQRIEVANLDFIRFFSSFSCRPCRPQQSDTLHTGGEDRSTRTIKARTGEPPRTPSVTKDSVLRFSFVCFCGLRCLAV